jgi:AraC-like DNA-binding protein
LLEISSYDQYWRWAIETRAGRRRVTASRARPPRTDLADRSQQSESDRPVSNYSNHCPHRSLESQIHEENGPTIAADRQHDRPGCAPDAAGMTHYYRLHNGSGRATFRFAMPGFQANLVLSRRVGETVFEHCEPHHRIIVTLGGSTAETIAQAQGAQTVTRPDRAGSISIIPADTCRRVILKDPALSLLTIAIAPDFIEDAPARPPLIQNGRDDWLWRAALAFEGAALAGGRELEHQGLAIAMARHLQRLGGGGRRLPTGLDPAALRRVIALMQERMAETLSLADLAGESGLSVSAFGRAFRQSTGLAPHRYFTALRMQHAKALLRRQGLALVQIAGVVGYSDQAHFTTAFARHTGLPPARWRERHAA